jgi:hypothetical protein
MTGNGRQSKQLLDQQVFPKELLVLAHLRKFDKPVSVPTLAGKLAESGHSYTDARLHELLGKLVAKNLVVKQVEQNGKNNIVSFEVTFTVKKALDEITYVV